MEEKKTFNWSSREKELKELLDKYRSKTGGFDCIVPVSGGKDGSTVAYNLKHKYGMNPLTVTVRPPLALDIGDQNLYNFIHSGFNHIHITADPNIMKKLNKYGFIEKGFPYYGWLIAIMTAVIRTAYNFNIPLIFYGEDGEIEYGGSTESKNRALYDIEYMKRVYLEGYVGKQVTKTLFIVAKEVEPLKLELSSFNLSKKVHFSIEEIEEGKKFRLKFTTLPGLVGKHRGVLKLKTNYSQKPLISIPVYARLKNKPTGKK